MEDELRLVKGEIKRTLVDLRAVVMQADSPFERIVAAPAANAPAVKEVVVQTEQINRSDSGQTAPAAQPGDPAPQQPEQAGAQQPIQPVQIGVPPAPQGPVGSGPQAWPNGDSDDREESDPRHDLEDGNGRRSRRSRDIEDELADTEELHGRRPGRSPRASRNGGSNGRNGSAENDPASDRTNGRSKAPGRNGKVRPRMEANGSRRARPSQVEEDEWEMDDHDDHDEDDVLHGVEDASRGVRPGLNINLISGLVRWVSNVQDLLGDAGMEEMVDLYFKTTKDSPGTRELISRIADTLPYAETSRVDPRGEQGIAEQWMDMLIQLHGVLNWDCVPPDIPGLGLSKPSED